jgi:hypothetical protein
MAMAMVILTAYSFWNMSYHGFFGLDQMRNTALFCATARYLNPAEIQEPRVAKAFTPIYAQYRDSLNDGGWVYTAAQGPYRTLQAMYPSNNQLDAVLGDLAWQAIRTQPGRFLYDRISMMRTFFMDFAAVPLYFVIPETSHFVYQGLDRYKTIMASSDARARSLIHYGPAEADAYFARFTYVPTGRPKGQLSMLPKSDAAPIYHYDKVLWWWKPLMPLIQGQRWLPLTALISAFFLFYNTRTRYATGILCLAIGLHIAVSSIAAWQDSRFVVPILPLYWILAIGGLEAAYAALKRRSTLPYDPSMREG